MKPIILKKGGHEEKLKSLRKIIPEKNDLLNHFEKDRNIKFTNQEIESLLTKSLNTHSVLQKQNFNTLPPELRAIAKDGLRKALEALNQQFSTLQVQVKGGKQVMDFIRVEKGRFFEIENAENQMQELFILQIDEPEKIALYNEAKQIAKRMMEISEQTNESIENLFAINFWENTIEAQAENFANYSRHF